MKSIFGIFIFFVLMGCKNEAYSDSEKTITSENGNTSVYYKNSYLNGVVKDSLAGHYFDLAQEYSNQKKYTKAKILYKKAQQIEPKNKFIINALGSIYADMRNFATSNEYFEKSLKLDSLYPITYLNYGFSRAHNDEFHKAIELYNEGISLEKSGEKRGYFYYNMSRAYYQLDDFRNAIIFIDKSLDLVNDEIIRKEIVEFRKLMIDK